MKHFFVITSLLIFQLANAQNVGQKDSIVNYTDINGFKQGKWTKVFANKQRAYIAYFKNNKLFGEYKRFYENGKLNLEVNYDDSESGYAKIYYDNGVLGAEGMYINRNVKDGLWKYYTVDGKKVVDINFDNGIPHGDEIKYWINGAKLEKKTWNHGKMVGVWSRYFSDGSFWFQMKYKEGKRDGAAQVFFPNGKMSVKGSYKNNLKHGRWIYYNKDGSIARDTEFINGVPTDEAEVDSMMTKKIKEWDKMKGLIPDPSEENMMNYDKLYGPLSK